MGWLLKTLAVLVTLAMLIAGGAFLAMQRYIGPGPLAATRSVVIPRGAPDAVAESLQQAGVITNGLAFRAAAFITSLERIRDSDVKWLLPSPGPAFRKDNRQ